MNGKEEWRPIPGWEGDYEVSDHGRVRSMAHMRQYNKGAWRMMPAKIRKPYVDREGYLQMRLSRLRRSYSTHVHRLVAMAFAAPRPGGTQVNHIDGNKANNMASNLEFVSASENQQHRHAALGQNNGESHHKAKLTRAAIAAAMSMRESGRTLHSIAATFGVCRSTIGRALNGHNWRHDRSAIAALAVPST